MTSAKTTSFFKELKSLPAIFWLLNLIQMLEKLAYWCVLLQLPIYIAQKDDPTALHWEQTVKGLIFFWWALVQNIVPVFSGGFADRLGNKRIMAFSFIIIAAGYLLLGTQRDFYPFLAGTILLGFGSGVFKPALQGAIGKSIDKSNSSIAWGVYFMLLNLAVFFGPPLSKYLKQISWQMVFFGSMSIIAINFILVLLVRFDDIKEKVRIEPLRILKATFSNFVKPEVFWFVLIMSGFCIIYMQFYETLPNFIYDWADTSDIVRRLGLPDYFTMKTSLGTVISYEWLYNLNAILILLFILLTSWLFRKVLTSKTIFIGIILASIGLLACGASQLGALTIAGIVIYTFGEMLTNPRFTQHLNSLAGKENKSMYLSYLNISSAIGLGLGSLSGGWLYKNFGEKSSLAYNYIGSHYHLDSSINSTNAFSKLQTISGLSSLDATHLLWSSYSPFLLWQPFVLIGLASAFGMIIYWKKYRK